MSNEIKGTQELPIDVPPQDEARYRVRQIPGIALWFVWDSVTGKPYTYPHTDKAEQQGKADHLNRK